MSKINNDNNILSNEHLYRQWNDDEIHRKLRHIARKEVNNGKNKKLQLEGDERNNSGKKLNEFNSKENGKKKKSKTHFKNKYLVLCWQWEEITEKMQTGRKIPELKMRRVGINSL